MSDDSEKVDCKYGADCYRENPKHKAKYNHPSPSKTPEKDSPSSNSKREASLEPKNGTEAANKKPKSDEDSHAHGTPFKSLLERTKDSDGERMVAYKELLHDPKHFIRDNFFVSMPDDFFSLWEFCQQTAGKGKAAEKVFEPFGLRLVGPFDVLAGKFDVEHIYKPFEYLTHWRFFYDVPEFQTVLVKDKSGELEQVCCLAKFDF